MVYMPRKAAFILMLVLSALTLVGGSSKRDAKEFLIGAAVMTFAVYSLVSDYRKKKKAGQGQA